MRCRRRRVQADLLVRRFNRRAARRAPRDVELLHHCNAALAPSAHERMTSQPESAVYPGPENTMEIAFAVALPAFIAGVFYLALWLQWQPG
jgi:hypothetical protein